MKYLEAIKSNLNQDSLDMLKRIYEPTVVATPLSDSRRDLCVLPNGEIRSYGKLYTKHIIERGGQMAYLSSTDCGLSWKVNYSHGKMNSCTYIDEADIYLASCDGYNNNDGFDNGLYVYRSKIGPDDADPEIIKVGEGNFYDSFLPVKSVFNNRVWFTSQKESNPYFFYSDDYGKSWITREIKKPGEFEIEFPHKGLRWCKGSGTEPYVAEVEENHLMMLLRNPMDCFYMSHSYDNGDTWSDPEPTNFYGTNTTAFLLRLESGKILSFWNNTKPLYQPNLKAIETSKPGVIDGKGENGFTNRDVAHVAVSDDCGKTFKGYRELILNAVRNNADFRYTGGIKYSADKSVHQFQAFELPYNKVLVSVGQNIVSRRLIIFDLDWLYENSRTEDFLEGVKNITSHTYLKSVSGSRWQEKGVGNGHCAYNRTYSAYLMPSPEGDFSEVLSISKNNDDRRINDISGMCWNFPLSKKGRVSVTIKIEEKQARFILSDRWYNTCDAYVTYDAPFFFDLDVLDTGTQFCNVDIDFDTEKGRAEVYINGEFIFKVKMKNPCAVGLSYLIMQCATDGESKGFYLKNLRKRIYSERTNPENTGLVLFMSVVYIMVIWRCGIRQRKKGISVLLAILNNYG